MKKIILKSLLGIMPFAIFFLWWGNYNYNKQKEKYIADINSNYKGIITYVDRIFPNNPKALYIKINDSIKYPIPYSLNNAIEVGDSIVKEAGKDYYCYYKKAYIIKYTLGKPSNYVLDNSKDSQSRIDTIKR